MTVPLDDVPPSKDYIPICAIGASAGGVNALRNLFKQLPDDLGLAYVVIVHLAPEHPSAMAEILSMCTEMPVHQVDDTPVLRANCVYVIPPDRELVIEGDHITARPFTEPRGQRAPIDMFFRSVASARGDGMAVILTGAGADGSTGVRAIQESGGVVFAQDPAEAEFPAMPQNAIATGVVNFVAPISRLADRMAEVARSKEAVRSLDQGGAANELRRIVGILRERTGHDFDDYKRATVMRRVLRRMQVNRMTSLAAYHELVMNTPEEAQELFKDLLISVTHFFRDPPSFEVLAEKAVKPLFDDVPAEGLRIWSAGCATGEEAYSLAILFLEEAERRQTSVPIQIFATDLDPGALATAREARYPYSIEADVSPERLSRFFIDEGTHYRIRREVREIVLFTAHSVLKDPPFLRMDLIACRNLLIYLERSLQEQLIDMFSYGLRRQGFLFLGSAESADASSNLFASVDRDARLYQARPRIQKRMPTLPHVASPSVFQREQPESTSRDSAQTPALRHAAVLEEMAPPSILIDGAQHIVHMSPNAGRFILHSGGTFSGELSDVVRPELRLELKIALDRALDNAQPTLTFAKRVAFDGGPRRVAMQITSVPGKNSAGNRALVVFLDAGPALHQEEESEGTEASGADDYRHLHAELKAAQEALVASRSDHETAIEDLRAANEELQSINEEYRSTSEELETSKEELQSMNEELRTVNSELKAQLESTSSAHSDLRNLISAAEVGTLFLDTNLKIRMFTPPIAKLFSVTEMDIGRMVSDFTSRLIYTDLENDARKVLGDLMPLETEVESREGRWYMLRLRPYRTMEDKIEGVVLSFVDITSRRETERQLFESQQRYQILFDSIDEGFAIFDMIFEKDDPVDYRFVEVNAAFERQTGLSDVISKTIRELVPEHEKHWFEIYGRVAVTGEAERFEAPAEALGRHYDVYAFKFGHASQRRVAALFRDVTSRKEAEALHKMLTDELSHRVKNTLAVVQALARQPSATNLSVEQYRDRFIGRIQALARAHDQLLETHWQSADLETLIRATLAAYSGNGQRRLALKGPAVSLTPKQGLGLALVLHELATNASKYGSLSTKRGRLDISWKLDETDECKKVCLTWRELDGPRVQTDSAKGFGTRLINQACTYELEGAAELELHPDGFVGKIEFPIQ